LLKVKDKWFRILVVLLPSLVALYVIGLMQDRNIVRIVRAFVSIGTIILIGEGSRFIIYNGRRWFSGFKRVMLTFFAGIGWITLMMTIAVLLASFVKTGIIDWAVFDGSSITLNHRSFIMGGVLGFSFLSSLLVFPVLLIAYEIIYHFAQLRHAKNEKERLEKEKLKAELQQLKGIINPHFLFNNLNSLSSLIGEDPGSAQDFLDELTKVFRYLLRNNETELTTLSQELNFIRSYYHLLQTRYGKAISMDIQIDSGLEHLLIPPLTLQLLVENAVKHNRLQKESPLHIDLITAPGNKLAVRNNLLKREGLVESTGIGLQNINARYRILRQPGVVIEKDEHSFAAIISLIEPGD
jgi:two-component system, LytTR family, sensor kinase